MRRLLVPISVLLLLASCGRGGDDDGRFAGVELPEPVRKPDFVLTDTDGEPYDFRAETEGRLSLLYFGYTNCPDICPIHLAQVAEVLERPGMPDDVTVVFVSVDPARDTPERIRRWLDRVDRCFVGLTGSEEELVRAQEEARVPLADVQDDSGEADYLVGHAGQVLAYAPDGVGYTAYPYGTRQTQWAHDLPLLAAISA